MKFRPWTDEEYGFVLESTWTSVRIAEHLDRSVSSIRNMRHALRNGWAPTKEKGQAWTPNEDAIITSSPSMTPQDAARLLPNRTPSAVEGRRKALRKLGREVPNFNKNTSPFKPGARPLLAKTCPTCGLLLQEKWFGRDPRRNSRTRNCKRCGLAYRTEKGYERPNNEEWNRKWSERHKLWQEMTREKAENNGQPWMDHDMTTLSDPDMTILEKAFALKRTYAATQQAAKKFAFPSKTVSLGDPLRDQWIIDNPNAARVDEIQAQFKSITDDVEIPEPELLTSGAPKRRPEFDWDE